MSDLGTKLVDTADPLLTVDDLSIRFGGPDAPPVVRNLSFQVRQGETVALVGESGSGKSVTSMALMGLLPNNAVVTARELTLHGQTLQGLTYRQWQKIRGNQVSVVFQEPMTSLNPVLKIGTQLTEAMVFHERLTIAAARSRAIELLEQVRMPAAEKRLDQYPHELSGGMRQRVMIALALACRPRLLIADEPTTALDVTIQAQIVGLLEQLRTELNMGVLLITHDMGVVAETANRVVVMQGGEHKETGEVRELFKNPVSSYTKALLAAVPRLGQGSKIEFPCEPGQQSIQLLDVEHLSVRFPIREGLMRQCRRRVHAVEDVSLTVRKGETVAVVGESGSGKSTLARAILNLTRPSAGAVRWKGKDITGLRPQPMRPYRRSIQMIYQDPYATLDPRMSVGKQIAEPLIIHRLASGAELKRRVDELLTLVGLSPEMADRFPHEFSGGQRQRICIARALAVEPELIICDEAVSALDVSVQEKIIELLISIQVRTGVSYLFISHDIAVVEQIAHRVAVMYLGRLVEIGRTADLLNRSVHDYTRTLLKAVPVPDPERKPVRETLSARDIPSPVHPADWSPSPWEMREIAPGHRVAKKHPLDEVAPA